MARQITAFAAGLAWAVTAFAAPSFSQPGRLAEGHTLTLGYDGVLVVKVFDMRVEQRLEPTAFSASAHLKSYGVLALFKKIDVEAGVEGRMDRGAQPVAFHHVNHDGEANRAVEVRWTSDDVMTHISVPYPTVGDPLPTREQKLAAADPLTQLTRIALTSPGREPCREAMTFFDGREVYRLSFAAPQARQASVHERELGLVHPLRCAFTFTEVAGFDPKPAARQNQGLGQPLIMDLAQVAGDGRWVIAAVRGRTPLGEARVELRRLDRD
jgi:hypothetical protein